MSWFPKRKRGVSLAKTEVTEASAAAREAGKRLQATQDQWPEVTACAKNLAEMRERNHFADMIRAAILGGG